MSGEKDARVEAIDPQLMREAVQRASDREHQRQQTAEACAAAARDLTAASSRLRDLERARAAVASQHSAVEANLQQASVERARTARRIEQMRRETIETRDRAHALGRDIAADQKRLENDLSVLAARERELQQELRNLESRIADYDGHQMLEARDAAEEAERQQARVNADLARLDAELAAYSSSPALGFVIEQMVSSFSEFAFHVERAHVTDADIEIVMSRHGQDTVRIATAMIDEKLAAAKLDPRLRLLIERAEPDVEACIADTTKIIQRLREKGVVVSLEVREPAAGRPAEPARVADTNERSGTK
jgi:DNA repair exonuclease SbcCD ATPase subunit